MINVPKIFTLNLVIMVIFSLNLSGKEMPDMVPMPKKYEKTGDKFIISGKPIYIDKTNRQCQIAVDEINERIKYLKGKPGSVKQAESIGEEGIFVLPVQNPVAKELIKKYSLKITAKDPGEQGYIIHTAPKQLLIIGSDNIGTLYGAMTLRQMMEAGKDGKVYIDSAEVYDYPDYKYRSNISFTRGIEYWSTKEKNKKEAYKKYIDWLARFKMNLANDYTNIHHDIRELSDSRKKFIKDINQYAVDRGFYPVMWFFSNVANAYVDKGEKYDNWDCITCYKHYFCWSRDKLAKETAKRAAEFCKDLNFKILCLHPVDGGGVKDPELWSKRCPECKKRWKDDERWKASAHQFNIWANAIKEICPEVKFSVVQYLYTASLAQYSEERTKTDRKTWQLNVIDYWKNLHKNLDPDCIPQTWMAIPAHMEIFRKCFPGRAVAIFGHSIRVASYFGTWHRFNKTDYSNNPKDIFFNQAGKDRYAHFMNVICDNEYCWNVNAPGSENFTGLYYDIEKDHTGPREIIDDWVPRACRAFYGKKVGDLIAPVYQLGILNKYIMKPGETLRSANKYRRFPLAEAARDAKGQSGKMGARAAPDVIENYERIAYQAEATQKAMKALEKAYRHIDTLGKYQRKNFMYYYKRMPLWHLTANVRKTLFKAGELQREGKYKQALKLLNEGMTRFENDLEVAEAILDKTKNEPDMNRWGAISKNDIDPSPKELRKVLQKEIKSAKIVLKPRRPGKFIKIAIFKGYGEKGTRTFFEQFKNVKVEIIKTLSLSVLDRFDCLFMLQNIILNNKDEYVHNLRRYVGEGGGGVIFQHDMCGFERFVFGKMTPFPKISPGGSGKKNLTQLFLKTEHPLMPDQKVNTEFQTMYYDVILPIKGNDGIVILTDKDNIPVVIAGKFGHGKVVFDGTINLDTKKGDVPLWGFNELIAQGAVEWFTGVKLIKK